MPFARTLVLLIALLVGFLLLDPLDLLVSQRGRDSERSPTTASPEPRALTVERTPVAVEIPLASPEPLDELSQATGASEWVLLNNEATQRLAEGELLEAAETFERCHEAEPESDVFRRNLAEALVRLAREEYEERLLEAAIARLERALELAPDREDAPMIEQLAAHWRDEVEVEENHWTEDSDLFELSYDTDRDDILQRSQAVLDHLERAYEDLYRWFAVDPVRERGRPPVRVVLYKRAEFGRLTGLGDWAGGAFDGVVRVAVEDLDVDEARWKRVLTHELVHVFVHELGGNRVPGWLNEGLAQFLETTDTAPAVARAAQRLGATLFPLTELQGSLATWSDSEAIGRAYAQSLLLVDRIASEYGEEALRRMIFGCATGVAPEDSFEAWASVPLGFVLDHLLD